MKLNEETVTDENGNDFAGLTTDADHAKTEDITAFTFIRGDNGFQEPEGLRVIGNLKRLEDGKLGR